jgi:hypothetical protein
MRLSATRPPDSALLPKELSVGWVEAAAHRAVQITPASSIVFKNYPAVGGGLQAFLKSPDGLPLQCIAARDERLAVDHLKECVLAKLAPTPDGLF